MSNFVFKEDENINYKEDINEKLKIKTKKKIKEQEKVEYKNNETSEDESDSELDDIFYNDKLRRKDIEEHFKLIEKVKIKYRFNENLNKEELIEFYTYLTNIFITFIKKEDEEKYKDVMNKRRDTCYNEKRECIITLNDIENIIDILDKENFLSNELKYELLYNKLDKKDIEILVLKVEKNNKKRKIKEIVYNCKRIKRELKKNISELEFLLKE